MPTFEAGPGDYGASGTSWADLSTPVEVSSSRIWEIGLGGSKVNPLFKDDPDLPEFDPPPQKRGVFKLLGFPKKGSKK